MAIQMTLHATIPDETTLMCDMGIGRSPYMITLVGAGGKTSTLFWLAEWLLRRGRRVLIATSTQMFMPPPSIPCLLCRDPLALPEAVFQRPLLAVYARWLPASGKVQGFDPQTLAALCTRRGVDVVLVEGDGSRGLPIKAPALHEPCIPSSSQCVIAVSGGQALGQSLGPERVHRWAEFSAITGASAGQRLTLDHLGTLLSHPQGMFKNVPPGARRIWLVNQFSQNENLPPEAFTALADTASLSAIWLGAVQGSPAILRRLTPLFSGHRMDI